MPTLSLINAADDIDEEGMPIDRTPMEPMAATPEDIIAILDAHNLCRSEAAQGINPASNLTASGMPRLVQLNLQWTTLQGWPFESRRAISVFVEMVKIIVIYNKFAKKWPNILDGSGSFTELNANKTASHKQSLKKMKFLLTHGDEAAVR